MGLFITGNNNIVEPTSGTALWALIHHFLSVGLSVHLLLDQNSDYTLNHTSKSTVTRDTKGDRSNVKVNQVK